MRQQQEAELRERRQREAMAERQRQEAAALDVQRSKSMRAAAAEAREQGPPEGPLARLVAPRDAAPLPVAAAPVVDRVQLRCVPVGVGAEAGVEGPALMLDTRLSARVAEVAVELHALLGTAGGQDALVLVHQGHVLAGRTTLREANVQPDGELGFYFAAGGAVAQDAEAVPAPGLRPPQAP